MQPERTAAAPVDALLVAQALWTDDQVAVGILLRYCDPWAVSRQLAGWLRCAILQALDHGAGDEFGDRHEFDVIDRWLNDVQQEVKQ